MEVLLACVGTKPNHMDVNDQSSLAIAAERGYLDVLRVLLDREDSDPSLCDAGAKVCCIIRCVGSGRAHGSARSRLPKKKEKTALANSAFSSHGV